MALNPNAFVDGVMNGFSLHIEPPSYYFQMFINSFNGEYKMLSSNCFYSLFIQTKINKQTKQNKTVVKIHESLEFTCWGVKQQIISISCSTC